MFMVTFPGFVSRNSTCWVDALSPEDVVLSAWIILMRQFRSDLFYRLNVFPIHIPPLRERREDIPLLIRYFVQKYAREMQKPIDTVPSTALKHLQNLDWPGNIRELENFIERAVILTSGKTLVIPLTGLGTPSPAAPKRSRCCLAIRGDCADCA